MGEKAKIAIKDLQVGSEYWVVSGLWSFKVLSKHEDHFIIKHIHGEMKLHFDDDPRAWVIEEYN